MNNFFIYVRLAAMSKDTTFEDSKRLLGETIKGLEKVRLFQEETARQMQETDRKMQETDRKMQETDRKMREMSQETDRKMKETSHEIDRISKAANKRIKHLDNLFSTQWGALIESLVTGQLVDLLKARGMKVNRIAQIDSFEYDGRQYEFDAIVINSVEVVVVEVKTTLTVQAVDYLIDKLNSFKKLCPEYSDKVVYGAVAYLKTKGSANIYSEKNGLFVIKATGDSASITNEENFKPKKF